MRTLFVALVPTVLVNANTGKEMVIKQEMYFNTHEEAEEFLNDIFTNAYPNMSVNDRSEIVPVEVVYFENSVDKF